MTRNVTKREFCLLSKSLNFNTDGDNLLTSSFDNTAKIWDVCTG